MQEAGGACQGRARVALKHQASCLHALVSIWQQHIPQTPPPPPALSQRPTGPAEQTTTAVSICFTPPRRENKNEVATARPRGGGACSSAQSPNSLQGGRGCLNGRRCANQVDREKRPRSSIRVDSEKGGSEFPGDSVHVLICVDVSDNRSSKKEWGPEGNTGRWVK